MNPAHVAVTFLLGLVVGWFAGSFIARQGAQVSVIGGPYSDNYGPALIAIADAQAKLRAGDSNVVEHLQAAEAQIRAAQAWTRQFLREDLDDRR